jgi:hypothetical protein
MEFIKKDGLKLENGGYLFNTKGEPVSNEQFVNAQRRAHYLVKLAEATKGKDYVGKKADSFTETVDAVVKAVNSEKTVEYVGKVAEPKMDLKDKLAEEALSWIKFDKDSSKAKRVNEAMQQFNIIKEFETFGQFFSTGIVKLEAIYTIDQILKAVEVVEPHLDSIR